MEDFVGQISISESDSKQFAELSGDYNPMHVDAIYARRLQFGGTVTHGIHTCLKILDDFFTSGFDVGHIRLSKMKVVFQNPVRTNHKIQYKCKIDAIKKNLKIKAVSEDLLILSMTVYYQESKENGNSIFTNFNEGFVAPDELSFPPNTGEETELQLLYSEKLSDKLFPKLNNHLENLQIAQILSTTQIVGMKCPGLHSVFSELNLDFTFEGEAQDGSTQSIKFWVEKTDFRFKQVRILIQGKKLKGKIYAFFRPPPVFQPKSSEIKKRIKNTLDFRGQKVLVIGGSRGLGEVTAKILGSSDAEVAITYFKGKLDAERIMKDIHSDGGSCRIIQFDSTKKNQNLDIFQNWLPNLVCYFATPHIEVNSTKKWNGDLFRHYSKYYVDGIADLLMLLDKYSPVEKQKRYVFYPSTVFVDSFPEEFKEYALAKICGEEYCQLNEANDNNLSFFIPRLPRLKTDQTNAISEIDTEDTVEVMCRFLKEFEQGILKGEFH